MALAPVLEDREIRAATLTAPKEVGENASSPDTAPKEVGKPRLYHLDLLRFLAAVAVVLYHYTYAGQRFGSAAVGYPTWWTAVSRYGYLGVELFFLISGFVAFMSAWGRTPATFAISRFTRLYPAYWLGVVLTSAVGILFGAGRSESLDASHITWGRFGVNLTMMQSFAKVELIDGVYWTLACELAFYAMVFILAFVGITRRSALTFIWGWLAASVILRVMQPGGDLGFWLNRLFIPDWSYFFIAGMAFYLWREFGRSVHIAAIIVISYGCTIIAEVRQAAFVTDITGGSVNPVIACAIVALGFALVWLIADGKLTRFARPSFATLGVLTYPLYLLHAVIGYIIFNALDGYLNRWLLLGLVMTVMLGFAWLITRYVERPLQPRLRNVLTRWFVRG